MGDVGYKERLAVLLEMRGWSHGMLAQRTGISRSNVSTFLGSPGRSMSFDGMMAIAQALDVSLDWLATGETRSPEELTPEESALLAGFRAILDSSIRRMILRMVQEAPKGESE